jgi:hypothetical protein
MPAPVTLNRGTVMVGNRPDFVHPEAYDGKVAHITPLGQQYPITFMLDKMRQGKPTPSLTFHWHDKPFNPLTGRISDVYTNTGLTNAHSGAAASGTTVVVKPHADDVTIMANVRPFNEVIIHSTSVYGQVTGYVNSVDYTGATAQFSFTLLEADTNSVLAGTGLTWTVMSKAEEEKHELGDAVSGEPTDYYNYVGTDTEPFEITFDELGELSRIENGEQEKMNERELEARTALNLRREFQVLEGRRTLLGTRRYAGGLRYFLAANESGNIINWRTDTTYSENTDTAIGGTLPFLRKVMKLQRKWKRPGMPTVMVCSATTLDLINECVLHSGTGTYKIDEGVNQWGLAVQRLRGLSESIDLVEDALFSHYPSAERSAYIVVPEYLQRHQPTNEGNPLTIKKGLMWVPWSANKDGDSAPVDGSNYASYKKGAWISRETYSFRNLAAHAIIDNLGLDKA